MRYGGDELGLHFIRAAYGHGHLVYGIRHFADLIVVLFLYLDAVAAVRYASGNARYLLYRLYDGADEHHVHQKHQSEQDDAYARRRQNVEGDLPVHLLQAGDIAHYADDLPV